MSKKEKQLPYIRSEFHAIVPLSIDDVMERLATLADKQTQIKFDTYLNEDIRDFELRRQKISIKGRLQRWQGTETRLDANISQPFLDEDSSRMLILILLLIILGFGLNSTVVKNLEVFSPAISILIPSILMIIFLINKLRNPISSDMRNSIAVEDFLQDITKCLIQNNSTQLTEFDGSEDALTQLLETRNQSLRIGSDGELQNIKRPSR